MQAALEAARPENRSRALNEVDQDTLAATTMASNNSRVRFYEAVCRTWGLEAWPLSRESVRAFGACLKAGAYRSVAVYFSALIGHQVRTMWQAPSPELRRCIHDTKRAVMRGAGPAHLKDSFHVPVLCKFLQEHGDCDSYDAGLPTHMADTLLICCWWMLREIEAANAQVGHVSLNEDKGEVTLLLPVQKCDTRGMLCCRTLRCACRVARHVMCPFHSMRRHMERLGARGPSALSPRAPLFPGPSGGVMSHDQGDLRGIDEEGSAGLRRGHHQDLRGCRARAVHGPHRPDLGGSVAPQPGRTVADAAGFGPLVEPDYFAILAGGSATDPSGDGGTGFAAGPGAH